MQVIIETKSGAKYVWHVNERQVTREGDGSIRATAWDNVRLVAKVRLGDTWEFTGWPGELRTHGFAAWCAKGEDDILTSRVQFITVVSDGVRVDVPAVDVLSIASQQ